MMTNLFSSFDPSTSNNLSLNWMSTCLSITMIPMNYWLINSRINLTWNLIVNTLHNEFKILLNKSMKSTTLMIISILSLIMFNNISSLFPYIFASTSHLTMTLTLSLPLWVGIMLYGWLNNATHMFIHLVPQGTPMVLVPFMICIETISNVIRPGTLAIRLMANMTAGHLLLTLLGSTGPKVYMMMTLLLVIQLMLFILESAVAIIQSYVFSILSTLYCSEVE